MFDGEVLDRALACETSCMAVSSTLPLPEKDFKAVLRDGMVRKVGVSFFEDAVAAQALYRLRRQDWKKWLDGIVSFCESVGLTSSAAINLFVKAANRERRTPSRSRSTTPSTAPPTRFTS